MAIQEFQWSRCLVVLLLDLAPRHLVRMPWRLRATFVFALMYYPLFATMTAVGLLLPPVAALTGHGWLGVNYVEFLRAGASPRMPARDPRVPAHLC